MEKTLIIFKPDSLMRGFVGEILARFERVGLKIIAAKMLQPNHEHYFQHYEGIGTLKSRKGEKIFDDTLGLMMEGPVLAMVLEGVEAAELVRKMVGPTEPKAAQPGTIRGDYAHVSFDYASKTGKAAPNMIHASADSKEAEKEIAHWFSESELFDYDNVHQKFTHLK